MTADPVIELENLWRVFDASPPVEAVRGANLEVSAGDYLAVVGPSGSGKSSLLHLLGLLDRPTSGIYRLQGVDTADLGEPQRAGLRSRAIGFVFQSFHLMSTRTATENVMLADVYRMGDRSDRRARAEAALRRVGLSHRLDAKPTTLSGGERQRVAVARALMTQPAVLLADEPTGNLDTSTTNAVMEMFDELAADGLTIIMITHDHEVADRASRRVEIRDGELRELASRAPTSAGSISGASR